MNKDKIIQLNQGFNTAFIDYTAASNLAYRPQFVSNNYKEGRKVISSIEIEWVLDTPVREDIYEYIVNG